MNDEAIFPIRRIWLVSILVAVGVGAPLSFFSEASPWVMAIPIVVGVSVLCWMELFAAPIPEVPELPLIKASPGFFGLTKYKGHVALSRSVETESFGQEMFAFLNVQRKKTIKATRIIRDPDTGEQIYLIDTERFMSLFLARTLPNVDQVTEVALRHALHRFGEMQGISSDFEKFMLSKSALEVIKADFRSNTAQTLNNASEAALREATSGLIKEERLKRASAAKAA